MTCTGTRWWPGACREVTASELAFVIPQRKIKRAGQGAISASWEAEARRSHAQFKEKVEQSREGSGAGPAGEARVWESPDVRRGCVQRNQAAPPLPRETEADGSLGLGTQSGQPSPGPGEHSQPLLGAPGPSLLKFLASTSASCVQLGPGPEETQHQVGGGRGSSLRPLLVPRLPAWGCSTRARTWPFVTRWDHLLVAVGMEAISDSTGGARGSR